MRATATEKAAWPVITFGEMVKVVSERVDPAEAGTDCYVGLEHLDSGTLTIHRHGHPDDVSGQKLRFYEGDVIFGKRRAYQRKLAVARRDGICSAHAMVLRARLDVVLPEFLPFLMQSNAFMERAVAISVGSLSPTINWKTLKTQTFPLPPLGEQRRIARLLWMADEAVEAWREVSVNAKQLYQARAEKAFNRRGTANAWQWRKLSEVASVERGKFTHRPRNLPKFFGDKYPFAQTGDVAASRGEITSFATHLSEEGKQYSRSFPAGTMLVTIAAVIGATAITPREVWCTDSVVGVQPEKGLKVEFLEAFFRTRRSHLEDQVATQTAQKNINLAKLRPMAVPLPSEAEQEKVVERLSALTAAEDGAVEQLNKTAWLQHDLREHLLNSSNGDCS